MKTLNVIRVIVAVTIIALAEIAVAAAASLLLVQSASATDVVTSTTVGEEGATTSGNTTTNNNSNVTLGNLFYSAQGIEQTFNPINDTYIVISYLDNVTLMPPNATGVVINATETGNFTANIQPNGLSIDQGQGFIMTEDGTGEENATATFVSLSRTNPDGTGSGTGVVFFSTNSTGQLAFLNNMVGIAQIEFSSEGSTVKIWDWKGGTLPFETGAAAVTTTGDGEITEPETRGGGPTTGDGGTGGDLLNCADITERNFAIDPNNDPNNFDGDNDGIGCETEATGEITEPETRGGGPTDLGPYGNVAP